MHQLLRIALLVFMLGLASASALAYSGFPTPHYPGNQWGHEYYTYRGPWGERMVHGGYGYFPNFNGYRPYGYRPYGAVYTPWDIRYGHVSRYG